MTSHPLYSWQHTHSLWNHKLYTCDITANVSMTRHPLCLWHHSIYDISHGVGMKIEPRYLILPLQYVCNQTHLIDITTYLCMKSRPLHVGLHRHYLWHHILSWWPHTIVYMSWKPLLLWHYIQYVWCHTHCVYDNTSSISDFKPILSAITSTVYIITHTLSKTSQQQCKRSQVAYVCHHVHYTWHHIHPLRQQPLVFMTSHALFW